MFKKRSSVAKAKSLRQSRQGDNDDDDDDQQETGQAVVVGRKTTRQTLLSASSSSARDLPKYPATSSTTTTTPTTPMNDTPLLSVSMKERDRVLMARHKRQLAQIQAQNDDFIALEDDQQHSDTEQTRLQREDDEMDDADGQFSDDGNQRLAFGTAAVKQLDAQKRREMHQLVHDMDLDEVADGDDMESLAENSEDEELRRWEDEQIRKGANYRQESEYYVKKPVVSAVKPSKNLPSSVNMPSFSTVLSRLQHRMQQIEAQKLNAEDLFAHLKRQCEQHTASIANTKAKVEAASGKYYYFQELRGWLDGLADMLELKMPQLNRDTVESILDDASDDYTDVIQILTRFETWRNSFQRDYEDAWVDLSLAQVLQLPIRRDLYTEWHLFQDGNAEYRELDQLSWHQILLDYGQLGAPCLTDPDADATDEQMAGSDPDAALQRILGNIVTLIILPHLKQAVMESATFDIKMSVHASILCKAILNMSDYLDDEELTEDPFGAFIVDLTLHLTDLALAVLDSCTTEEVVQAVINMRHVRHALGKMLPDGWDSSLRLHLIQYAPDQRDTVAYLSACGDWLSASRVESLIEPVLPFLGRDASQVVELCIEHELFELATRIRQVFQLQ